MTWASGNSNSYTLANIPAGALVRYYFTIGQSVGAYDTSWQEFSCCTTSPAFSLLLQAESFSAMNGVQTQATSDSGGGQNVGWIEAGDWMSYANITIPSSGSYRMEYRVASPSGSMLSLDLNSGSILLGNVTIPATGDWQNWTTVSQTVTLTAGTYSFGIYAQQSGWNFNWFRITRL